MSKKQKHGPGQGNAPGKASTGRADASESIEGHIPDHPEGEDFDVEVDVDVDIDDETTEGDRPGRRSRHFEWEMNFGPDGPFGPKGPFGPDGPFGAAGLFGKQGLFGRRARQWSSSGEGHGRGGPRRRGRMFGSGELRLVLLALIDEEPRHGYDCIKALEEATQGAYAPSPGVIYPTLQMLLDEGLIGEQASTDSRKIYQATDAGRAELEANKPEIEALLERLGRSGRSAKEARSSDMVRSLGNLAAVLANRAARGGLSGEVRDQVVDLIDELAKKIERL